MRRLAALVLVEAASLGALVAVSGLLVQGSLPPARADDLVAVGLWVAAVAVVAWLLASTLAFVVVETLAVVPSRVHRAVARVTPRAVRAVVTRALVVSMLTSAAAAYGALASEGVRTGRDAGAPSSAPQTSAPAQTPTPASTTPPWSRRAATGSADRTPTAVPHDDAHREHRIEAGENLWCIAAAHLHAHRDVEPTEAEIASYWVRLIESNRGALISGDPDLVYPGEIVTLPDTREMALG